MNPIIFALILSGIVLILTIYKGRTSLKAHKKFKQLVDEINELDTDIKGLLKLMVYQSVTPLFLLKNVYFGLFTSKKNKTKINDKIHQELDKKDRALLVHYTYEAIKNYLTFAPHWLVIASLFIAVIGFFAILFYSFDKLKQGFLTPIELNLFRLDTQEHKQHIHG
jgi:uncharacterized protein YdcH (DUF465 family)